MSCFKICWQFFVVEVPFCSILKPLKRTNTMDTYTIWMFIQSFSKAFMLSNNVEDRALLTSKFLLFNFDSAYAFIMNLKNKEIYNHMFTLPHLCFAVWFNEFYYISNYQKSRKRDRVGTKKTIFTFTTK